MDSPFYRNRWGNSPGHLPSFRGIPVTTPQTRTSRNPKVVSIPVHFVQPEECSKHKPNPNPKSRSEYAIRIQKMWRGFRVRKNVNKILEIQRELGEVETMILERETVEAIQRDERERLKVSERLMALLLRLDSVGGFDGAVRELRRTATRRAIALQEKVDSFVATSVVDQAENAAEEPPKSECDDQPLEGDSAAGFCELEVNRNGQDLQLDCSDGLNSENQDLCDTFPNLLEGGKRNPEDEREEEEEEESEPIEKEVVVVKEEKSNNTEESKRNREMLEKMVEENNKLMALMADLFERNEMQTRILSSLSQRVEQLENAFACEKLRRAKKLKKSRNSQCLDKIKS